MAFDPKRLNQTQRAGDWAEWVLQTTDTAAAVAVSGYIVPAKSYAGLIKAGHVIKRVTYTDTTYSVASSYGSHLVMSATATAINLSDETAGVVTNATTMAAAVEPPPSPRRPDETEAAYRTRLDHEHKAWVEEDKKARAAAAAASAAEDKEEKRANARK